MPISQYDDVINSEKNAVNESASFSTPHVSVNTSVVHNSAFNTNTGNKNNNNNNTTTVIENRHNNNNTIAIPTTIINNDCTMNTLTNEGMHSDREVIYGSGSYHASGLSYTPPIMADGTTTHINNNEMPLSYKYVYDHKGLTSEEASPKNYEYSKLEAVPYGNISDNYKNRPYDINNNMIWKNNGYYLENEPYVEFPLQGETNSLNKRSNVNYIREPETTTIPAIQKTDPIKLTQTANPVYIQKDRAFCAPKNMSPVKQHNMEDFATATNNSAPYISYPMIPHGATKSARYVPCKVNPISNKFYDPRLKENTLMNYPAYPSYPFFNSNCESVSSDYMQYDPMRPMVTSPPIAPVSYVVMKENDRRCILQKGIDYAMNSCKRNRNPHYSKHEYFIKGAKGTPVGAVVPYVTFPENKKFDMFKRLTLKVGTCLDDLINVFIESLNSSIEVLHKNNDVRLHDLHPFYNPDPVYTRPERPTLKTGNNIIDNINTALDGTTLEKHKNVPKTNERIPIPKTEKTGHVVVDGLNSILDKLLIEPLSYQKYDYYSDKVNIANKSK